MKMEGARVSTVESRGNERLTADLSDRLGETRPQARATRLARRLSTRVWRPERRRRCRRWPCIFRLFTTPSSLGRRRALTGLTAVPPELISSRPHGGHCRPAQVLDSLLFPGPEICSQRTSLGPTLPRNQVRVSARLHSVHKRAKPWAPVTVTRPLETQGELEAVGGPAGEDTTRDGEQWTAGSGIGERVVLMSGVSLSRGVVEAPSV